MFLSLITKITGDYQATTLLGSGLGMFIYILIESERGMLVIHLTWGWAWHARLHLTWVRAWHASLHLTWGWAWHVRHRPLEASGISLAIRATKPKA